MSIKSVRCPRCNASMNVPASMASTRCPSCGETFAISTAGAAAGATSGAAAGTGQPKSRRGGDSKSAGFDEDDDGRSEDRIGQWLVVGGVAGLAVVGLILLVVFSGGAEEEPEKPKLPVRTQATVVENLNLDDTPADTEYREVNLPESTRQQIYRDYSQMIASSFGKAKKIPSGGAAGQALNKTLGSVVDREVTHMALVHGISEEDIAQIYAEGQAKGWK
ncbi:hypothetical protein Enr13x_47510 [Stieleria neptunia]|uniref:Uncharacterized protein n=1 Tax=Stieleria neptunia TaxID=2527979 RepID=A0A518HVK0_9BACT|nr:hypothetical protein [Stieleria neptunia]QDV44880.1 hypothetical protein Enr13x_47510 [Stieleria neptunia]